MLHKVITIRSKKESLSSAAPLSSYAETASLCSAVHLLTVVWKLLLMRPNSTS